MDDSGEHATSAGFDRHITVFSPEGRLYQVEYAFKAAKGNITGIGVRDKDSVVFTIQKKPTDKLIDSSSVTSLFKITDSIAVMITGLPADMYPLVTRARQEAIDFRYKNGISIPIKALALKIADLFQLATQHSFMRPLGIIVVLGGDNQIYRLDPSGNCIGYSKIAVGYKEQEGIALLEKVIMTGESSGESALSSAIIALQEVIGVEVKSTDIEVAIIKDKVSILSPDDIEKELVRISKRD